MMNLGLRIRQGRVAAELSVKDVAQAVGVSRNAVYKWERGDDMPRQSILIELARLFKVDVDFFFREARVDMCQPTYRKKASLPKKVQACVEARIMSELEKQFFVESLFTDRELPKFTEERQRVESLEGVESVADRLRASWGLGSGPVGNLVSVVEEHGIRVVMIDAVPGFDGFSCFVNENIPVIALPSEEPGDRQRFTLAHELGHMVLESAPGIDEEKAAHRFAGAFLAPQSAVIRELGDRRSRLDLDELLILKRRYGMSMQAWARRAFDGGVIDQGTYESLCRTFSRLGWRKHEPDPGVPGERPTRMELLVRQAVAEGFLTPVAADELLGTSVLPVIEVTQRELAMQAAEAAEWYRNDAETEEWLVAELGGLDYTGES